MRRLLAAIALMSSAPAFGAFSSDARGTAAATFLTLGAGARAAAMGGAQTAATEGAFSLAWNPAGIAARRAAQFDVMHADWLESSDYNVACAALPVGGSSAIGIAFQQYAVGDIARRDSGGFEEGSFSPSDTAATLAWARRGDSGFSVGIAGKFIRSKIVDSASTAAVDLGALSPEDEHGRRWGVAVANLGGQLTYDEKGETLPVIVAAGGTQRLGKALLAGDLKFPRDNQPYLALGAEYALGLGGEWRGLGRLGYSTRAGTDSGGTTGLAAGLGLSAGFVSLDYAFAPFGDLGSVHLFSLSVRGGGSRP